jgi:hypothetical protein
MLTFSEPNGSGMKPIRFIIQMNMKALATYGNQIRMPSLGNPALAIWL